MPTVLRLGNLRVVIYPNDHTPEHVHVIGVEQEAVFELHCKAGGPPAVRENYRFTQAQLRNISGQLMEHLQWLCEEWGRIHESD